MTISFSISMSGLLKLRFYLHITILLVVVLIIILIFVLFILWHTSIVRSFRLIPVILIEISDTLRVLREMSTREHFIIDGSKLILSLHSDLNILSNLLLLPLIFLPGLMIHRTVDRVPFSQVFLRESYSVFVHRSVPVSIIINRLAVKFQY